MKQISPVLGSVSLLIGVVIAILSLVRGDWLVPLLLAVFAAWGLWLILTQLLPVWQNNRAYQQKEQELQQSQDLAPEAELSLVLLHHVNYRISAILKAAYPKARWEWMVRDPADLVAAGGTGRIRVYGVPNYDYADVTLDQKANLRCDLIKVTPVNSEGASRSHSPALDPQVWFELRGRQVLGTLIPDLQSRGHSSLTVKEDGEIVVQDEDGEEMATHETLLDLPDKMYWNQLVGVLAQEGISAETQDNTIRISW